MERLPRECADDLWCGLRQNMGYPRPAMIEGGQAVQFNDAITVGWIRRKKLRHALARHLE